jgi:YcaO-like protein with predicted kinase domain
MILPKIASTKTCVRGTHRTRDPAETVAAIRPFLPEMGVTRIADVTGLDHIGIPTVMAVRPNARSLSVSQGKGVTLDAAKASGMMEAVEQWHAERIDRPLRLASAAELSGEEKLADFERMPKSTQPCDRHTRLLWAEGRELWTGRSIWLPYEAVSLDLRLPLPAGSGHFLGGSNGLASGNDLAEAIAHGLWEVIERDALTLFYARTADEQWRRRLNLRSVSDDLCVDLLERYERASVDVAVWDIATDLEVPSFLCAILDRQLDPFRPVGLARGSGSHPDRTVALTRALTEAAQSRLTRIAGTRDDIQADDFDRLRSEKAYTRHRAQLDAPGEPPRRFDDIPTHLAPTFEEDLAWARERLAARGIEQVAVVDLSREAYPVCVAKVIVPGLEGLVEVPGYVPGGRVKQMSATCTA